MSSPCYVLNLPAISTSCFVGSELFTIAVMKYSVWFGVSQNLELFFFSFFPRHDHRLATKLFAKLQVQVRLFLSFSTLNIKHVMLQEQL
jgi:hypothetical protein